MTNRIDHTNCDHEATPRDRAACRKAQAEAAAATEVLIQALFAAMPEGELHDWLLRGAYTFASYEGSDRREAAEALLSYFGPVGEAEDARRRANGYIVTTDASTIRRTILRRHS